MNSEKIILNITQWLKNYSLKSNTEGYVVGVSGGIDSALTSTLCAKTGLPLLCLEMPIFQKKNEISRSKKHIEWLKKNFKNVSSKNIDLSDSFDSFRNSIDNSSDEKKNLLALANTRSRFRMLTLYYYASIRNSIVVGTGNKVEDFGVGFYTKYGDGGVDISPIADLFKSEVFKLAKKLNIIDDIIQAKPTDGLWDDGRTDEDQIGASYNELEWAMIEMENGKKAQNFKGRKKEIFKILKKFNKQNLHKIQPIPIYKVPEKYK